MAPPASLAKRLSRCSSPKFPHLIDYPAFTSLMLRLRETNFRVTYDNFKY